MIWILKPVESVEPDIAKEVEVIRCKLLEGLGIPKEVLDKMKKYSFQENIFSNGNKVNYECKR